MGDQPSTRWHQGNEYVRVSAALQVINKPAIARWAAKLTAEYAVTHMAELGRLPVQEAIKDAKGAPWRDRDAKADVGDIVHGLVSKPYDPDAWPVEQRGHLQQWTQFLDRWQPEIVATERLLFHRQLRYTGRFDLLLRFPFHPEPVIVDVKTGRAVYPEVALQLAAYRFAEIQIIDEEADVADHWPTPCAGMVLHLRPRSHHLVPVRCGPAEFATFTHLLAFYRGHQDLKDAVGKPIAKD